MKILHTVEFYAPSVGGMQEVVKQLSERLARRGHEVTVATRRLPTRGADVINGVRVEGFDITGNLVTGMTGEVARYREFVANGKFDIVTNFAAQQWATDALIEILDSIQSKKVFVPTGFSALYDPLFMAYFGSMRDWLHGYDMNIFLSEDYRDINFARECGVEKIMVIPNGADEDEFLAEPAADLRKELGIPEDNFLVLLVGSHTGIKGHREAIKIFADARIANATLLIVANDLGGPCTRRCKLGRALVALSPRQLLTRKKVQIRSLPRSQTVAAYKAADLFLFPSNVECSPLVLFEAMAGRTPFLTTKVGNAEEIIAWSGGGELLPTTIDDQGYSRADIAGSVGILENLFEDQAKREVLGTAGYHAWLERFTWKKITEMYEDLYFRLSSVKR